jgi:hypothetical protein
MSYSKKKLIRGLSRKKVANLNPREYTLMGASPEHIRFNPAGEIMTIQPISYKLEKWILMILLAFAMAAFMGFKLLENSDLSFSLTDGAAKSTHAASSIANDSEFKTEFNKVRADARGQMEQHKVASRETRKDKMENRKMYAHKKVHAKGVAKRSSKKRIVSKSSRRKTIARR